MIKGSWEEDDAKVPHGAMPRWYHSNNAITMILWCTVKWCISLHYLAINFFAHALAVSKKMAAGYLSSLRSCHCSIDPLIDGVIVNFETIFRFHSQLWFSLLIWFITISSVTLIYIALGIPPYFTIFVALILNLTTFAPKKYILVFGYLIHVFENCFSNWFISESSQNMFHSWSYLSLFTVRLCNIIIRFHNLKRLLNWFTIY